MTKSLKKAVSHPLFFAFACFFIVLIISVVFVPDFFTISTRGGVFSGRIISILDNGSTFVILAVGMTLVVASSGGTDISVGAVMALSASVIVALLGTGDIYNMPYVLAFIIALGVGVVCGMWNGFLVARLKIQPMIATLILFVAGRGLAFLATGGGRPYITVKTFGQFGGYLPGIPFPTPIFVAIAVVFVTAMVLRFTSLGMQIQSVGINRKASRLVGVSPTKIIFICYVLCGLLAGLAGLISASRVRSADPTYTGINYELDAILAVAIGGNSLGGGKFSLTGSVIGALTIQSLTTFLLAVQVSSYALPVYKGIIIIIIVVIQSPELRRFLVKLFRSKKTSFVEQQTQGGDNK